MKWARKLSERLFAFHITFLDALKLVRDLEVTLIQN